jgi:hypothetical protein
MTKILELLSNERAQYLAFFGLALGAAAQVQAGVLPAQTPDLPCARANAMTHRRA